MTKTPTLRITAVARTPIGALGGQLSPVNPLQLGCAAVGHVGARAGIAGEQVKRLFLGGIFGAGIGPNPAQRVAAECGLDDDTLCLTVRAGAGSALTALLSAGSMLSEGELAIVGGFDSATAQPYLLPRARRGSKLGGARMFDGADAEAWTGEDDVPLNVTSALNARRYEVDDARVDAWKNRPLEAIEPAVITPVEVMARRKAVFVERDEAPGAAPGPFHAPLADAAGCVVLSTDAEASGPRLIGWQQRNVSPNQSPLAAVEALGCLLAAHSIEPTTLAQVELDESLGVSPFVAQAELGISPDRLNPYGGSLNRGYPGGACAALSLINLTCGLAPGSLGAVSYGLGSGSAIALLFEG